MCVCEGFVTMGLHRFSSVQQVVIKSIILFGLAISAFACEATEHNDYVLKTEIWTEWYSIDDPVSGDEDLEDKNVIYSQDSRCSGQPTDVQCRAKYSKMSHELTRDSSVTCTTNGGLRCRSSDQPGGRTCLDYEIRFKCADSTPFAIPEYHFDFSGKTNLDDMDPVKCDDTRDTVIDRESRLSGTVYDNRLFYLKDGPPNSDHTCSLWTGSTSVIDFFPLLPGICVSEPLCCEEGLTLDFWAYTPSVQVGYTAIFGTGGHADGKTGFAAQIPGGNLEFAVRYSDADNWKIHVKLPETSIVGEWFHYTGVFKKDDRTGCLYINGDPITTASLMGCENQYPLISTLPVSDHDNMRLFERVYASPVQSKRAPDAKISDMKIYFASMDANQVQELHQRQTLGAYVHVYYIGLISDPQYEEVVLECKAHGSKGDTLQFRWLTTSDGVEFDEIDPASDPHIFIYNEDLMNEYQHVSRLHFINHDEVGTDYVCEAYDPPTMRTSSQSFTLTFPAEDTTWTPWMSTDSPDDDSNDVESLANVRSAFPQVCAEPLDVECRTLYTKEDFSSTGQTFSHACSTTDGLQCIGSSQSGGRCLDYEVRFSCPGENYRWTDWCNADNGGNTDDETFSQHKSQGCAGLCEFPLFAECRTVADQQWYDVTNIQLTYPYICTKEGLYCDKTVYGANCPDFKVRYACPYYTGVYPDYHWELGGRSILTDEFTTDCGSLSVSTFLSTTPTGADGVASPPALFTDAPPSVAAHCSPILDGSMNINLGNFSSSCITDASLCENGMTFTFWFQPRAVSGGDDAYFISTGSQIETSKGLAFYQLAGDGDFMIRVKTRFKAWDAVVDKSEFTLNDWKFVVISITPFVGISYYIDGVLKETVTEYSSSTFNIEYPTAMTYFVLGAENELLSKNGNAAFSDIRVYESALEESHVAALTLCGEADGEVDVTVVSTSHALNPTLTLECQVWGSLAPTIEWVWLDDIDQAGLASAVSGGGASISETNSVVGCWKISTLTIADYSSSVYANKDIVCKAANDVEYDLHSIHVEPVGPCEVSLGVSSGAFKALQFQDSVTGALSEVPGLDGTFYWDQQSASYLIIDLGVDHMISGIALQVHQDPSGSEYVPSVDIEYEDDSGSQEFLETLTLDTVDVSAPSTHWFSFSTPQNTSKLFLVPVSWSISTQLRVELYGCQVEDPPHAVNLTGGYDYMTNTYTAVCTAASYPAPSMSWLFSGGSPDMGRYSTNVNIGIAVSTGTVVISPFEAGDDIITISCQSTSHQGVITDSVQPEYGFTGSVMLSGPTSVPQGSSFTLNCDVSGDTLYSLDWFFQASGFGVPVLIVEDVPNGLTLSDASVLVPSGGRASLSLDSMESSHSGTYICSVNNGTKSDSMVVSQHVTPGTVSVTSNSSVYDRGTNSFMLYCEFDYSGDFLTTSWILPDIGEVLGNWSDSKRIALSVDQSSSLMIQSFNFYVDDGDYTCRGETTGGVSVNFMFTIHYAFSGTASLNSPNDILYGDTVVLTASVQGDTVYDVAWYYAETYDDVEYLITQSGNILLSDTNILIGGGGVATLTIIDFTASDDGVYTISINSGSAHSSTSLSGRELVGNITITGNTSNYHAASNTYLLTCEFVYDGPWLNVSWTTPSSPEIFSNYSDGKYEVISECCSSPATSSLLIYSFNYTTDDGSYQCHGYTSGGTVVSFNHSVEYEFTGTVALTTSNDLVENGPGTLACQAEGDVVYDLEGQFVAVGSSLPVPIVDSEAVWTSNSTLGIGTTSAISELRIDSWPSGNDGTYFCLVNQGSGQDSALVIGATLESIYVQTSCNSSIEICTMTCVASYTSITPNITWYAPPLVSEIHPGETVGRISVSEEDNPGEISSTFIITAADPSTDNINYTCRASLFGVFSLQNSSELHVPVADKASIVQLKGVYNGTVQLYWLQCTVTFTGIPANISWITPAEDNVTGTSSKFTVMETVDGDNISSVLLVNSTNSQQDDGFYTCQVYQNNILKDSEDVDVFHAYSGPLDMYLTSSLTFGETVVMECVAGDPTTAFDIRWYYMPDSSALPIQLITESPLHDVTVWTNGTESLVSRLHVNLFSVNENGVYTCSVNGGSKVLNLTIEETKAVMGENSTPAVANMVEV